MATLPDAINTVSELDELMTAPSSALVEALARLEGDLLILGVAGKMGPTMARLARRALDAGGKRNRVIGVARFSNPRARAELESAGVETVTADLIAEGALDRLPDAPNVVYLVGRKFGATGNLPLTWAVNTYLPALVGRRYRGSRIVALSTGNVYPLTPVDGAGPDETHPVSPVGEYAQSCLGRERMLAYMSDQYNTPLALIRLNYAIDLRYGVLLDIAQKVHRGQPIDLAMGYVNVIWQGDANEFILRALLHCSAPPLVLNLTGLDKAPVRWLATEFGRRLRREPVLEGQEAPTALLSNARRCADLFGPPQVSLDQMIDWVAHWVRIEGPTLDKPTHFQTRTGEF